MKNFSIIVPLYNNYKIVQRCLDSLIQYSNGAQIILYDDASSENNYFQLINNHIKGKNFHYFRSDKNLGFTKVCNNASKVANREFILFLNSDAFLNSLSLIELYKGFLKDSNIGVLGPMTSSTSSEQQIPIAYSNRFKWSNERIETYAKELQKNNYKYPPVDIKLVGGFAFAVRRNIFERLNRFDEDFVDYGGEKEFCIRARKNGYRTCYTKSAYVHHLGKMTFTTVKDINIGLKQVEGDKLIEKKYGSNWRGL